MPSRSKKERSRAVVAAKRAPASVTAATPAAKAGPRPRPGVRAWAAALVLLGAFAVQAMIAVQRDSVTVDEFLHLPVGLNALYTGDFRQDPIDPHLPLVIAALPLLANPPAFSPPPGANGFGIAYHFMESNARDYQQIFERTRPMIVLLSLVAAIVMARWAFDLYGSGAALVSLALFAFSPSLLAHGHLVTLDMAGALGFLLALYANWKLLDSPTPRRAAVVGLAIAVAILLKLSAVVLALIVPATWAVRAFVERRRAPSLAHWLGLLAVVAAVGAVALNAGYFFDGTFGLLRDATLAPGGKLARVASEMPSLRLPLPRPFLEGVDMVLEVGKAREPSYFLAGELSSEGWWYYHLAAFAAKCPFPVLLASVFATGAWLAGRSAGLRDYVVFLPVVILFATNSAFNSLYIGERHVLPVYPLLFIGISPWVSGAAAAGIRHFSGKGDAVAPAADVRTRAFDHVRRLAAPAAAAVLLAWTVAGTLAVAPRYLQFFNEAAGGSERGHRMLIDSNIDWGQDLIRLREYMDANGIDRVALAYFGRVDPSIYGIRYTPLERSVSHGKAVVSATFLMGRPYFWYLGGRLRWVPAGTYAWLQGHRPVARVGAMFVYDLP